MATDTKSGNRPRRWWLALLLSIFGGAMTGYLYVGRLGLAAIAVVVHVGALVLLLGLGGFMADPVAGVTLLVGAVVVQLALIVHVIVIAVRSRDYRLRPWNRWWVYLAVIVAVVVGSNVAVTFTLTRPFYNPAGSMEPSLRRGEHFMVDLRAFQPQRGDVIVFLFDDVVFVKRLIGLPGDTVQMVDGVLHLNGEPVKRERTEDYVVDGGRRIDRYVEVLPGDRSYETLDLTPNGLEDNTASFEVPAAHVFVLGDNRDISTDSRIAEVRGGLGFIPYERVMGRATWIHWPSEPSRFGHALSP